MIEIKDLTVKYKGINEDVLALNEVNLKIEHGDICTVIGPSGCGKSTMLHVLAGILKAYDGQVLIDGNEINPKLHRIGLVLQSCGLLSWKNVQENVLLGIKIKKEKPDDYKNYVFEALGIKSLLQRYPKELSGGQKQRVAIARSFMLRPDLMLMDEPFSALDAITRDEMQELFLNMWKKNRVTTVFITHSVEEAVYLGKKIAVLSPSPGKVLRVIENEYFEMGNLKMSDEYHHMSMEIRKIIEKDWSRC